MDIHLSARLQQRLVHQELKEMWLHHDLSVSKFMALLIEANCHH